MLCSADATGSAVSAEGGAATGSAKGHRSAFRSGPQLRYAAIRRPEETIALASAAFWICGTMTP
jgi:hypothetical protein